MEAQHARDQRRRRLALIGSIVLAIIAAAATYVLLNRQSGTDTAPAVMRNVVVAAVDIPARTQIAEEMLRTLEVPEDPLLAFADRDPAAAVGQIAAVNISEGQALQPNLYGFGGESGLPIIAPGETISPDSPAWRAVSVRVPRERAVGGRIAPGDHVDLYVTLEIRLYDEAGAATEEVITGGFVTGSSTKVTWTNVEVLEVDLDNEVYVLRVDALQAEEIAHIQGSGANNSFTLGLRSAVDSRDIDRDQFGQTTNEMIDVYGFPVPQILFIELPPGVTPAPFPSPEPPEGEPTPEAPEEP